MTTIDRLSVSTALDDGDQIPIWKNSDGVTQRVAVSAFDDRYGLPDQIRSDLYKFIGISATPPIVRANGDGLQIGDIYTDTQTIPITWIYSSSGWVEFLGALTAEDQAKVDSAVAQAQGLADTAAESATEAAESASALNAIVQTLQGSILEFNTFDLGYLGGTPAGTSIDLGNLS